MSWLESHQELRDHPKTARLRRRLGVSLPAAIGHLHLLWWWALDYAPTGHLTPFDADVIADAACWEDDPGVFVRALIGAGFLNDDMTIHDWEDYAGRLIDRREANAKRMRTARQERRAALLAHAASGARPADGTPHNCDTTAGRVGLPDLTGPNHTGPDMTTSPQPPPHAEGAGPMTNQPGRRRSRGVGATTSTPARTEVPSDLAPATDADRELWDQARSALTAGWLPANAEKIAAYTVLGRGADGELWLRAPPWVGLGHGHAPIAAALVNAGDAAGANVVIVEG